MNKVKLNETPVRTSRNFNINNIKLENIEIPEIIPDFENVTIIGDTSKINIEQNTSNIELVYGLNEFFTNQVKMQSNQKLKLTIDDKENSETQIEFKFDDENSVLVDDIEIIANENIQNATKTKTYYTKGQVVQIATTNSNGQIIVGDIVAVA